MQEEEGRWSLKKKRKLLNMLERVTIASSLAIGNVNFVKS